MSFGDISSANIVGYFNKDTYEDGHTMVTPTFSQVSADQEFTLADLSVTGYDKSEFTKWGWEGGCTEGDFVLEFLTCEGFTEAAYYWIDYKYGENLEPDITMEPGWYKIVGWDPDEEMDIYEMLTPEELAAAKFTQGQSFWTKGMTYQLVSAGAVTKDDIAFDTFEDGHSAIGNGMPVDWTLGHLSVDGYSKSEFTKWGWEGGCTEGDFVIEFLTCEGFTDAAYYWIDYKYGESLEPDITMEPGWYKIVGWDPDEEMDIYEMLDEKELAAVKVPAGQGLWVKGMTYQLIVPAPEGL